MQEVQFVSDLVINLMNGLSDFSAPQIDKFYKEYDEDFPCSEAIGRRLENLFETLAALPVDLFADTIFRQYQIAFSLMLVLDRMRDQILIPTRIEEAVRTVDAQAVAFKELDVTTEEQKVFLEGFTGGNLHRIKTRRIRDDVLASALT